MPALPNQIRPASDRSLLVSFGDEISVEMHRKVKSLFTALLDRPPGILNLHPAYTSILIDFDPRWWGHAEVTAWVQRCLNGLQPSDEKSPRQIEIPVCYGGEFGPDLEEVARHCGLTPERVVAMHSAADYLVYFLGFSPGFPYLGGLPAELATPRLPAPRQRVPAGSVAIGGSQAGIYPIASPGGWRIIGRTSLCLFNPAVASPALLALGDTVRFVPRSAL
jgi:KipI family sensor histidine kinase inhibitor